MGGRGRRTRGIVRASGVGNTTERQSIPCGHRATRFGPRRAGRSGTARSGTGRRLPMAAGALAGQQLRPFRVGRHRGRRRHLVRSEPWVPMAARRPAWRRPSNRRSPDCRRCSTPDVADTGAERARRISHGAHGRFHARLPAVRHSRGIRCRRRLPTMASLAQPTRAPASQGDSAHKRLFSRPRMVVDLLRLLGEPWVDVLDLRRLDRLPAEHVADDGRTRRQDMPWRVPFRPAAGLGARAAVLVHLEFQLRTDPYMAERMLEYAALLRRDLLRADGAGLMAGGLVPAHLPLLVYNGRAPWNAPLRVEARTAPAPTAATMCVTATWRGRCWHWTRRTPSGCRRRWKGPLGLWRGSARRRFRTRSRYGAVVCCDPASATACRPWRT